MIDKAAKLILNPVERRRQHSGTRNDDDIGRRLDGRKPEDLSESALRQVPFHRTAEFPAGGDSKPSLLQPDREHKNRHEAPVSLGAPLEDARKLAPPPQTALRGCFRRH